MLSTRIQSQTTHKNAAPGLINGRTTPLDYTKFDKVLFDDQRGKQNAERFQLSTAPRRVLQHVKKSPYKTAIL
jgi:hypothetical protein